MQEREVDVAIIGSGTAGLNAMGRVRRSKKSFVLINGGEAGTTCARVGCMPSKVIIQVAEDFHRRTLYPRMGIEGGEQLSVNIPEVMEHVRELRDTFVDRVLSNSTDHLSEEEFQASLRSRERFWDIRVPKIDSIFDNSLVPRPSWSPGVPPQHRKLVAATHRSPI